MSMKKTLVSALTTALAIGAASTAFAAANPFEDVPADHWSYDAIAQLAADGVIEGYGDGTYRGDQEITRYEMAQMIARAMAKNPSGADKAMVDKLAAEFADELNNLGVRVAALEKKVDNVKWHGLLRYTYQRNREDGDGNDRKAWEGPNHQNTNNFRLRLSMTARVNEHWTARGRIEYATEGNNLDTAANSNQVNVNRLWAQGEYGATTIMLGKFPYYTNVDDGMVFDDDLAGGFVQFGNKANVKLLVARYDAAPLTEHYDNAGNTVHDLKTVSMAGIELNSDPTKKFTYGANYHYIANKADMKALADNYNAENMNIWAVGMGYRFDKNTKLFGTYARNASGDSETKHRQAWAVQFDYKGSDISKPGSWGAFVAYRHLGKYASIVPTYNSMFTDKKGVNFGVNFVPLKNIKAYVEYFTGKGVTSDKRQDTVFGRVELYF